MVKGMRKRRGLSTRLLSKEVGKASSYISQLERGLILKPDYDTCERLLKYLGVEDTKIEGVLHHYGIMTATQEEELHKWAAQQAEFVGSVDWLEDEVEQVETQQSKLEAMLSKLTRTDVSSASVLISRLLSHLESKDTKDFLIELVRFDYTHLTSTERDSLLALIRKTVAQSSVRE